MQHYQKLYRKLIGFDIPQYPQWAQVRNGSTFLIHWGEYVAATKITGTDRIIQLLECCDEQLCKVLTHAAGRSLTTKTEADVLHANEAPCCQ